MSPGADPTLDAQGLVRRWPGRTVGLDGPFGALDALARAEPLWGLAGLAERLGKAVLPVTHYVDDAFLLADRLAVTDAGRILRPTTSSAARRAPRWNA